MSGSHQRALVPETGAERAGPAGSDVPRAANSDVPLRYADIPEDDFWNRHAAAVIMAAILAQVAIIVTSLPAGAALVTCGLVVPAFAFTIWLAGRFQRPRRA